MSHNDLYEIFSYMKNILRNFEYIIFYGTLLGYIRDNNFIEGDDDIDILLPFKDRERYLFLIKQNNIPILIEDTFFIQVFVKDIGPFDVYFYESRGSDILIRWDGNLLFSKRDIFPLKRVYFLDFFVNIPNNSEKILNEIYGDNWKTPIKKDEYNWNDITNVRFLT